MTDQELPKPRLINHIWYALGRLGARLLGWRVEGRLPSDPKYVIIAQHTSNWDFVIGLIGMAVLSRGFTGLYFCWMGKQELFRPPFGWLMRAIGGISIDRSVPNAVVDRSVAEFARRERMAMIVTPEGTRKNTRRWKTGFYHIACGARVPILCGRLDYRAKVVAAGMLLVPTGDIVADMTRIRDFYQGMIPRHPDQVGEIFVPGMDPLTPGAGDRSPRAQPETGRPAGK